MGFAENGCDRVGFPSGLGACPLKALTALCAYLGGGGGGGGGGVVLVVVPVPVPVLLVRLRLHAS